MGERSVPSEKKGKEGDFCRYDQESKSKIKGTGKNLNREWKEQKKPLPTNSRHQTVKPLLSDETKDRKSQ